MKYNVILADPPWKYDDKRSSSSMGMAESAYSTMTQDDLLKLRVDLLAADDCMLCLWATMPKLQEALDVVKGWGFKYITVGFVWVKLNPKFVDDGDDSIIPTVFTRTDIYSGLGHWCNGNAELVLLGKKGSPIRCAKDVKQIVVAPRGAHSVKPELVHMRIERLFGEVPRIELFARRPRTGWTTLGSGIDRLDIREAIAAEVER